MDIICVNFITTSLFSRALEMMVCLREIIPFDGINSGQWIIMIYPEFIYQSIFFFTLAIEHGPLIVDVPVKDNEFLVPYATRW